ncbi:MAG: 4Fe-4S binding protein [Anaerolineae bacterium]|jgi:formate hydrogenlyase subunit 6/NADH:ubiquinone oxidoreductase subunit I|nr:4Fe-4S binding protein [Anaerolineae bacterium]
MNWFKRNLGLLPALLDALIKKPDTVDYPFSPMELSENYRGAVEINPENCRGCNQCVRDCPALALELIRHNRTTYQLIHYPSRCTSCGQCEQVCRFDAIYLVNQFVPATADPNELTRILVDRKPSDE